MPRKATGFRAVIEELEALYGRPKPPRVTGPLDLILLENVAYLVSDQQREAAFEALRRRVGTIPGRILEAPQEVLLEVARLGGMHPEQRVSRLRFIAQLVQLEFAGDLRRVLKQPLNQARKALKSFPGIGDPGAEKILLFSKTHPLLALDSNGLRVLLRLGFGHEQKSYAASYRSAQAAVKDQIGAECSWLIRAHQLLRQHGQQLCRRSQPLCPSCPLTAVCRFFQETGFPDGGSS